jgi:hypothetical protein
MVLAGEVAVYSRKARAVKAKTKARKAKAKSKSKAEAKGRPSNAEAFTVPEFCQAHRISESFYYKLKSLGLGPEETKKLSKILITNESAAEWRSKQGEAA